MLIFSASLQSFFRLPTCLTRTARPSAGLVPRAQMERQHPILSITTWLHSSWATVLGSLLHRRHLDSLPAAWGRITALACTRATVGKLDRISTWNSVCVMSATLDAKTPTCPAFRYSTAWFLAI